MYSLLKMGIFQLAMLVCRSVFWIEFGSGWIHDLGRLFAQHLSLLNFYRETQWMMLVFRSFQMVNDKCCQVVDDHANFDMMEYVEIIQSGLLMMLKLWSWVNHVQFRGDSSSGGRYPGRSDWLWQYQEH